jgi:hypothetical protein
MTLCDICSAPNPSYRYTVESFVFAAGLGDDSPIALGSDGDFVVCAVCYGLIEANDSRGVVDRSINAILDRHPELIAHRDDMENSAIILHQQFLENRKGSAVAV